MAHNFNQAEVDRSFDLQSFTAGILASLPELPRLAIFSILVGALSVNTGLEPFDSFFMGLFCSAGLAQLTAGILAAGHAPLILIIISGLLLAFHFISYSAAIAPYLKTTNLPQRITMAFMLSKLCTQICIREFKVKKTEINYGSFYWGVALLGWGTWLWALFLGTLLGRFINIYSDFKLILAISLLSIVAPQLRGRPKLSAALTSATLSILLSFIPYHAGFAIAVIAGLAVGYKLAIKNAPQGKQHD